MDAESLIRPTPLSRPDRKRSRLLLGVPLLALASSLPLASQSDPFCVDLSSPLVAHVGFDYTAGTITKLANCACTNSCTVGFRCYPPVLMGVQYALTPAGCDPTAGTCGVVATVPVQFPGNSQSLQVLGSGGHLDWTGSNGSQVGYCGFAGAEIYGDEGNAWIEVGNFSCAAPGATQTADTYSLNATECDPVSCPVNPRASTTVSVDLTVPTLKAQFCSKPPTNGCPDDPPAGTCCLGPAGSGSPAGGGPGVGGPGPGAGIGGAGGGLGPGTYLWYLAGGAGAAGLPGSAARNAFLGRHWSHTYAEQIVPAPDQTKVWLITRYGTFREFLSPGSDGFYTIHWPKDEYRRLKWLGASSGWQLTSLDGTVESFNSAGLWTQTTDRDGNTKTAVYSGSTLAKVLLPDLRQENFSYDPVTGKLIEIDEVGVDGSTFRAWRYTWSGLDLVGISRPDGTAFQFIYGDSRYPGYMTQMNLVGTDGSVSIEAAWSYDGFGNVASVWKGAASPTAPGAAEQYSFAYTNPALPSQTVVTDPMNQPITFVFAYDPGSTKPKVTQTLGDCSVCGSGSNMTFGYGDAANPLLATSLTDGRGLITEYTYDANGRMLTQTDAEGTTLQRTRMWTYGDSAFPAFPTLIDQPSTSGATPRETALQYDAAGNVITSTLSGVEAGAPFSYTTVNTYNTAGMLLTTDPPGYGSTDVTSYSYDPAHGNLLPLTRTDPIIGAIHFEYDVFGNQTAATDANGSRTERTYDVLNRLTSVTRKGDPNDPRSVTDLVTSYSYTPLGDLFRITLPAQNVVEYTYDGARRLIALERRPQVTPTQNLHGKRELYTLDSYGHRIRVDYQHYDSSAGFVSDSFTNYQYSTRCHLDKLIQADGSAIEYSYDCDNNLAQLWDANHPSASQTNPPTQSYSHDSLNRKVTMTEAWGGAGGGTASTSYAYDIQDHLASVTDPNGNATTYTTSDRDLVTSKNDIISGTTTYAFNEHGQLITEMDARPLTTQRSFDALNRLSQITYPDPTLSVTYTYDDPAVSYSLGRLTAVTRNGASVQYAYNVHGQLVNDGPLTYQYDLNGNRNFIRYPGPLSYTMTIYNVDDQPVQITVGTNTQYLQGVIRGATYLPSGPLTRVSFINAMHQNVIEYLTYDNRYAPLEITAGSLLDWRYSTDHMGNISAIADALNPANSRSYSYQDVQYFLSASNGPWGSETMSYDKIGNRLSLNGTAYTYAQNSSGGNTPLLSSAGALAYAYDAIGNARSVGGTIFNYDAARQLSQIGPDRTFLYDGRGFLRQASSPSSTPTTTTSPIYGGDGLLHYRHDANASGTYQSDAYFIYLGDRPALQWEQVVNNGATTTQLLFLVTDHLGTPVMTTPGPSGPTWSDNRDPFGANSDNSLTNGTYLRFPGQWVDTWARFSPSFDLSYNVFRWYDAQTARYTSPETSYSIYQRHLTAAGRYDQSELTDWQSTLKLFAYAEQNPLLFDDPWGLTPVTNHSPFPIPVKPEVGDRVIVLCWPNTTCDVDGVYPPNCSDYPIKIVDGCKGEIQPDGKLVVRCPFIIGDAPSIERHFPWLGQATIGGRTDSQFHSKHPDWLPPNRKPFCGCPLTPPPPTIPPVRPLG